jgi:hypothetical protein
MAQFEKTVDNSLFPWQDELFIDVTVLISTSFAFTSFCLSWQDELLIDVTECLSLPPMSLFFFKEH